MSEARWTVVFDAQAVDDLHKLDTPVRRQVRKKLDWLKERAGEVRLEPLAADLAGLFKLRVGSWRVILRRYETRRVLVVHVVAHRRHVYKIASARLGG